MNQTAIIAGASGLVGSVLLQKLLSDPEYSAVICLVRRSLGIQHPKLKEVVASDFCHLKELEAQLRGDAYFCCLGTTIKTAKSQEAFRKVDFDSVVEFGRVAKVNEAKVLVVISASGASEKSKIFYSRVKGEAEQALSKLALKRLVIFRPGLLVGDRQESRPGEKLAITVSKVLAPVLPSTLRKRIATQVDDLAARMREESHKIGSGTAIIEAANI